MESDAGEQLARLRDLAVHLICGFLLTLLVLIASSAHSYIFELFSGRAQERETPAPQTPCIPRETPRPTRPALPKKPKRRGGSAAQTNAPSGVAQDGSICKTELSITEPFLVDVTAVGDSRPPRTTARPSDALPDQDAQPSGQVFIRPRRVHPLEAEAAAPTSQNSRSTSSQQ
jgi:hypothetical protein